MYGKCSKISNTSPVLMAVIRAGIHEMHVRIANREDPDQSASSEKQSDLGLRCLSKTFFEAN